MDAVNNSYQTATASCIDEAYILTLDQVLRNGSLVRTGSTNPLVSKELLAYQISISNPRSRILQNKSRRMNLIGAVARLVWMLAGNNRLEDIAWYEERVRSYSDDGLVVPGSNYGYRLFQALPGINQIEGVLNTIRNEQGTRRAVATIWQPVDAIRSSNDISCAHSIIFSPRGGNLITTMLMRSNNAFLLFPYNIFEFSFLAEMIACSAGLEMGSYIHFANSMHIYESQFSSAEQIVSSYDPSLIKDTSMPAMPSIPDPFEQANALCKLEAKLRHHHYSQTSEQLYEAGACLHEYWRGMYNVLLAYALWKTGRVSEANSIRTTLPNYLEMEAFNGT